MNRNSRIMNISVKEQRRTNEKERNDVSELFGITGDLVIKDKSRRCKHYQLSKEIFDDFVEFLN